VAEPPHRWNYNPGLLGELTSFVLLLFLLVAPRLWSQESRIESSPLSFNESDRVGFVLKGAAETGLSFSNRLTELDAARNRVLLNGSGVALGDYDGDGRVDVYVCGLNSNNALYRNLGGWKFEDVTKKAGVACSKLFCRGAVMADVNGDATLDLLVSTVGQGTLLFINREGRFSNETKAAGIATSYGSSTLALADVDGDGSLDLYVSNYRPDDIRDSGRVNLESRNGRMAVPEALKNRLFIEDGKLNEYGEPDQLYFNDGSGGFRLVNWDSGRFLNEDGAKLGGPQLDWGLSASFRDINGDREPDLYVCNDYWTEDRFWINQGEGIFRAISRRDWRSMSASSMGVDFSDIDRDGDLDFFTVDMLSRDPARRKRQKEAQGSKTINVPGMFDRPQAMRNTLFVDRGDGSYSELAYYAGLEASDWSWSPLFVDVDLDGFEDLLVSAGHAWDVQDLDAGLKIQQRQHSWGHIKDPIKLREAFAREMVVHNRFYPKLEMPIVAFRNLGGRRFEEVTDQWGTEALGVRHGMATADFDNDGDLDLIANRLNGPLSVYENAAGGDRVSVRLVGLPENIQAVGAVCELVDPAGESQRSEVVVGGRYLSGSEARCVFGIGSSKGPWKLVVKWRNGQTDEFESIKANHSYVITQGTKKTELFKTATASAADPLFLDVSESLGHSHVDPDFNEYIRQALLPRRLGQGGPGVVWSDVDRDGFDDLIIGGGQGQSASLYFGNGKGGWRSVSGGKTALPSDMMGILTWQGAGGDSRLLVSGSGYERSMGAAGAVFKLGEHGFGGKTVLGSQLNSGGVMTLGDLRGNGTLALFVAGGVQPGHYPVGAASSIFEWRNGSWVLDRKNSVVLADVGIVNGAVWSDLSGDGFPELVLACEWGPVKVFSNRNGQLYDATESLGLDSFTGWWRGVTTADLNGDGAMDIIASNWGKNSEYRASEALPLALYHGELARPGVRDILETEFDRRRKQWTPSRRLVPLASSLPFLVSSFSSHQGYSEAPIDQVLGERFPLAKSVMVNTLESMVFLNNGGSFTAMPLPEEAQWAPASGVVAADFDGDGDEDVFLAQNFFATRPGGTRLDGGRGLLMLGDGAGALEVLLPSRSGIAVYGGQKATATGDYNQDGRTDLIVTQNGAETKLFKNRSDARGLRVRLLGPPGNPTAIGAQVRLAKGTHFGPTKEIHGGAGYLSQSSPELVFHGAEIGSSLWIQWPGGLVTNEPIPEKAPLLTVRAP
jgi:enediyne biosynthesis protein E4